jgi:iron(III) transport system ATP-binding protein
MNPAIELRHLEKRFGNVQAVDRADLVVPRGALLVLLGPSGCGKTTILRMLAGLEKPTAGEILYDGVIVANGRQGILVPPGERDLGMVFQSYALWPHMTIAANIEWPLKVKRWPSEKRRERLREVLALMAIPELADRYPNEISGGQQQRASIARTIAPQPKILLFDEPLSNLDAKLRMEMRYELMRVHNLTGATSVYVTHDQVEAMTMATHVAVMKAGRIEQFAAPRQLLVDPATPFVATFIGTPPANVLHAAIQGGRYLYKGADLGSADPQAKTGDECGLMYRADSLALFREPGIRRIKVELAESIPVAGRAMIAVWDGKLRINLVMREMPDARPGETLFLEFPPQADKVFPSGLSN